MYAGIGGLAAIIIAGYLGAVIYRGNTGNLLSSLKGESGFLKWALALVIFYLIMTRIKGGIGFEIGMLAVLGMLLIVGDKVFSGFKNIFKGI